MRDWFRKKVSTVESAPQREELEPRLKAMPNLPTLEFYAEPLAHLLDELRGLNRLLAAHVLRLRRANFYEGLKDFRGFFIADEEIDALLAAGVFEEDKGADAARRKLSAKLLQEAQDFRAEIDRRVRKTSAQKIFLPLAHLAECFSLEAFEQRALLVCLAPQIDARYEKLYAYLQNDLARKSPSVDLILGLLLDNAEERLRHLARFQPGAPLRYYGLIESLESESGASSAQRFLRADVRVLHYALGHASVDERVRPHLRFLAPLAWGEVVAPEELQTQLRQLLAAATENDSPARAQIYLHGRSSAGKKTLARALCGELSMPLATVDVKALLRAPESFAEKLRLILRESLLQPCLVYFDHLEKLESLAEENPALIGELVRELHGMGWLTFLGSENPLPSALLDLPAIYALKIPQFDHAGQTALWQRHLQNVALENTSFEASELASRFDLAPGQIARAARRAHQAALVRNPKEARLAFDDLLASSRAQSQPKLALLARKIEARFTWQDLVLPEDQARQLRELVTHVRHKHVVLREWGFASKLALGRGLNALFAGPSGTGKTMAAEVMANDLGLDLYKVDLSAVVSKYIGETEKNLNRVFTEAEHSNAILFFDEADALMGKRSEVKDAHDRYANIEIAYLLQKMEEYEGITILATNLRQNLDEAFTRRIRFIVEFPFPNEEYRLRIWQGIWPRATPLASEVDLNFLARSFKLTGGNIRNIALAAAFLASENGREVRMKHLLQAAKREFQKMGKPVKEEEFGGRLD